MQKAGMSVLSMASGEHFCLNIYLLINYLLVVKSFTLTRIGHKASSDQIPWIVKAVCKRMCSVCDLTYDRMMPFLYKGFIYLFIHSSIFICQRSEYISFSSHCWLSGRRSLEFSVSPSGLVYIVLCFCLCCFSYYRNRWLEHAN